MDYCRGASSRGRCYFCAPMSRRSSNHHGTATEAGAAEAGESEDAKKGGQEMMTKMDVHFQDCAGRIWSLKLNDAALVRLYRGGYIQPGPRPFANVLKRVDAAEQGVMAELMMIAALIVDDQMAIAGIGMHEFLESCNDVDEGISIKVRVAMKLLFVIHEYHRDLQ
jgi:hypothetical protein